MGPLVATQQVMQLQAHTSLSCNSHSSLFLQLVAVISFVGHDVILSLLFLEMSYKEPHKADPGECIAELYHYDVNPSILCADVMSDSSNNHTQT